MFLAVLLCLLLLAAPARGAEPPLTPDTVAAEHLRSLDTAEIDRFLGDLNRELRGYAPPLTLRDALQAAKNQDRWDPWSLLRGLGRYLVSEVLLSTALLGRLLVLAVIGALLQHLQSSFERETAGKVARWAIYLVLVAVAFTSLHTAMQIAREVLTRLAGFMMALLPTLLTLLAGVGGIASAAIFHPAMLATVTGVSHLMEVVVFPLLYLAAVVELASGVDENLKLSGLAGLLKLAAVTAMGLGFTVFLGVVAVKGAAGAVADGVTLRSGKFLASTFIPVVGKMFSDAAELVIGSSLLLKNAVGLVGAAAILLMVAFPLLKIVSLIFVYRLAGALVQPVGAGAVAAGMNAVAGSLTLIAACVAVVALMFIISVTVMLGAGNLTVMLR